MAFETSKDPRERKKIMRMTCIAYLLALLPAWFFTSIGGIGLGLAVWIACVFFWHHMVRRTDKEVLADKASYEALLARRDSLLRKAQLKIYPETRLECFALLEEIDEIMSWGFEDPVTDMKNMEAFRDYRQLVERKLWRLNDDMSERE